MADGESTIKHPFILEALYRDTAARVTGGDLSDPDAVLQPLISLYQRQREAFFEAARKRASEESRRVLDIEYERPWWRLMPITLPPYRSNHEFALTYTMYRLMKNGNMTFLIGPQLGDALFRTDFELSMGDLPFPSDTFVIYYKDSSIPVYDSTLRWLFVDRVDYIGSLKELRIVYGYIDSDGDYANSGFLLFTYQPDVVVSSEQLYERLEDEKVSKLSLMEVTDQERQNAKNVVVALFNFLLYFNAVGDRTVVEPPDYGKQLAGMSNAKKRRRLEKQIANQTIYRYTYVGQNYESRVVETEGSERAGGSTTLDHRVLVRGHWRYQWIGKQRDAEGNRIPGTAQKLVWIEP